MILHTHSQRLERWLGPDKVEELSRSMRRWTGPPIAVAGVPGSVWAMPGGDFRGPIAAGQLSSALDYGLGRARRVLRQFPQSQRAICHLGFGSLSDLIFEALHGKRQALPFRVAGDGTLNGAGPITSSTGPYRNGPLPPIGGAASAAPGGRAIDVSTAGSLKFQNATSGDSLHFVEARFMGDKAGNTLLLYDRLFDVLKTQSSTVTEAVTGVPTRYQSTTPGAHDYAAGNFCFVEVNDPAGLTDLVHSWTVCQYTNQAGTTGQTFQTMVGCASSGRDGALDFQGPDWFLSLASGDTGVKALTQMQCSAALVGQCNFVMGHPIAFMPVLLAGVMTILDGLASAFNLVRIEDNAALTFMEICLSVASVTTYSGNIVVVSG